MKYDDYSLKDFLTDGFFLNWVKHPDPSNTAFWINWLQENPAQAPTVKEAVALIKSLDFKPDEISDASVARLQAAIHQRIDDGEKVIPLSGRASNPRWYWLAASMALIAGLVAFLNPNLLSDSNVLVSSGYGETKIVFLPDSSRVTLNANSRLSYAKDWQQGSRDVYLEGEAFFEVRKVKEVSIENASATADYRKFRVLTKEVTVEVLGTTFDVQHRRGETKVVLKSGKVQVMDNVAGKSVTMKPGDMVRANQQALVKEVVNPTTHTAWKDNMLVFDNVSLSEIARLLEDNYDFDVKIEDSQLGKKTFQGTFPADDIDLLLQTLSKTLDAEVDHEQKEIIFKNKP